MTIDLFRPFVAEGAALIRLSRVLAADEQGRRYLGEGPLVKEFERRFAALVGTLPTVTVAVNSCSSALALALQLADVAGGEVISTPMSCTATNEAIVNAGARIVWADIHPANGLIDAADVARKLTPRTRAIMAVDWGGHACDYRALRSHGIPVIEDAAHALLSTCPDPVGGVGIPVAGMGGDYVCFSLGPIKHLNAGHGGMLVTHRGDAHRARKLRWHSLDRESSADFRCAQEIAESGHLWHMTDIEAAIGLANIDHAEWVVARHRLNAAYYDRALAGCPGIQLPPADHGSSYWCYFLLVEDRAGFMAHMAAQGIQTSPVHRRNDIHPCYSFPNGPLPGVDYYDDRCVAIPVGWHVSEADRERVAGAVLDWAHGRREAA
jgi:dTDP-4-amino-4,6-dideoxygalactose transaminase